MKLKDYRMYPVFGSDEKILIYHSNSTVSVPKEVVQVMLKQLVNYSFEIWEPSEYYKIALADSKKEGDLTCYSFWIGRYETCL